MDLQRFTEEQRVAIMHTDGPMLVLAGPGSGKTTVITERVRYLIEECGVHPGNILVITFTKAAAEEMKERYEAKAGTGKGTVNFGTFHAVFFKILRFAYNYEAANILKEDERYKILREIACTHMQQEITDEKEFVESISGEISRVKNERFSLDSYYSSNCPDEVFREIYTEYDRWLRKENKVDFDDMQLLCYELLTKRPDILKQWQQKYTYVLIDEFQDINRVQYDTVRLLAAPENNLFIVGDDDQSLYRFRGATVDLFTHYPERVKERLGIDIEEINLQTNYRSTENIIEHCNRFAELDQEYQKARVANKPKIIAPDFEKDKMPILGMFRNNPQMLAKDLSVMINKLVNKGECDLKVLRVLDEDYYKKMNGNIDIAKFQQIRAEKVKAGKEVESIKLKLDGEYGSASDIAILSFSFI